MLFMQHELGVNVQQVIFTQRLFYEEELHIFCCLAGEAGGPEDSMARFFKTSTICWLLAFKSPFGCVFYLRHLLNKVPFLLNRDRKHGYF